MAVKKKILIAASLLTSAHLYIWDEPLNYIDVFSRMQIENLILEFAPTMLLVEHDMNLVMNVCEAIAVVNYGKIIAKGTPEEIKENPVFIHKALKVDLPLRKATIAEYEKAPEDTLYVSSLLDMRVPGGKGTERKDGAMQNMGMYSKDSAFNRAMKLQEALYKVQGRIAKIADSLRGLEESEKRMGLEKERLELMRMRATGAVTVPDADEDGVDLEDEE